MKVKEFLKKYKDYSIELFGRPLDQKTIPYTFLPKDKDLEECDVVDFEITEKEHIQYGVSFKTMKPIKPKTIKGYARAYVK